MAFVNFLLDAEVAAQNAVYTGYATANKGAIGLMGAAVQKDPVIYPPLADFERLYFLSSVADVEEAYRALWHEVIGE